MSSRRRPVYYKDLSPTVAPPLVSVDPPHKANLKQLEHFTHEHPLILADAKDHVFCAMNENCSICGDLLWDGPIYRCNSECNFLIHKSCTELPERMVNVFHLQHHLCLLPTTDYSCCNICNRLILRGFTYKCVPCNFILHIKCALQHKFQEPQGHRDHSFILLKPTLFICDGCGIAEDTIKRVSCLCTTCQFQVHNNMPCSSSSSFPLTITQIRHSHELSHLYSFQLEGVDFINKICKICNNKMNSVLCVYYCAPCDYIAHVSCATLQELRFEDNSDIELFRMLLNKNQDHYPAASAPDPIETKEITRLCRDGEDQNVTELQHSSHPHCLILRNDEPKFDELCDGCARPISIPFYACADQCNFSLHKQCAELPNKIQHPLHRHPLILHAKATQRWYDNFFGIFECKSCKALCNGFSYTCVSCNFYIDVGCSLILNPLRHEGHMCPLSLVDRYAITTTKCSACGLDCFPKLVCEGCNFNLDYRCASLPKTMSHDCPKPECGIRPFKLTYGSVDDGSGHYYCDICEEPRGQNHWFYYCEDCDCSAHPHCVLSKNLIKFGKTYLSECHPHSLRLVKKANGYGSGQPPCATCGDPCEGVAILFCRECDIYIHHRQKCCGFGWVDL